MNNTSVKMYLRNEHLTQEQNEWVPLLKSLKLHTFDIKMPTQNTYNLTLHQNKINHNELRQPKNKF